MDARDLLRVQNDADYLKFTVNAYLSKSATSCKALPATEATGIFKQLKEIFDGNEEILDGKIDVWESNEAIDELDVPERADLSEILRSMKDQTLIVPVISTKTFVRPKKSRSSLSCLVEPPPSQPAPSPKLRRRLTTTIAPSPGLIPHLQHLAKDGNRPVSANGEEELRWEDGAPEAQAESALNRCTKPTVPASILQRLQEIKSANAVRQPKQSEKPTTPNFKMNSPFRAPNPVPAVSAMSVSQLLRDIPDPDSVEMESLLSLGDATLIGSLEGSLGPDRRFTFGGVLLPTELRRNQRNNTSVHTGNLIQVNDALNSTFTMEEEFGSGDKQANDTPHFFPNCTFEVDDINDENRNQDVQKFVKLLNYSSEVFDSTFPMKPNGRMNKPPASPNNVQNVINQSKASTETFIEDHKALTTHVKIENGHEDETVSVTQKTETKEFSYATYSKAKRSSLLSTFRDGKPASFKSQENLLGKASRESSRDHLERSPARSEDFVRRGESSRETLILSPAPSDVALDRHHGTYTRNSPVERYVSEDEQMSTTSDHSAHSLDDIPNHSSGGNVRKKYHVSTPILSDVSRHSEDWLNESPICIARSKTSVTPVRRNGNISAVGTTARKLGKTPGAPGPLKQPLIQPTENFRRPVFKKSAPVASIRNPTKSEPITPRYTARSETTQLGSTTLKANVGGSNLPKPSKLPGRLPVRTSSIPTPNSRIRPSLSK